MLPQYSIVTYTTLSKNMYSLVLALKEALDKGKEITIQSTLYHDLFMLLGQVMLNWKRSYSPTTHTFTRQLSSACGPSMINNMRLQGLPLPSPQTAKKYRQQYFKDYNFVDCLTAARQYYTMKGTFLLVNLQYSFHYRHT